MLPIVRDVYEMFVLPQEREVKDPQVPDRSCKRTCEGPEEIVIVSVVDAATNLYHTSDLFVAPQPTEVPGKVEGFQVAFTLVPPVLTHDVLEVNVMAPEQLSLLGCAKEILVENIPSNKRAAVAKGYRKRFISS